MTSFFEEYKSINLYENINVYLGFFLGVILLGVFNNFPDQRANATVFFIMVMTWGFSQLFNRTSSSGNKNQDVLGVGNKQSFFLALIIGAVLGFFLFSQANVIVQPIFSSVSETSLFFGFLYVVVAAPFIEANFFRGLLMPSIRKFFVWVGVDKGLAGVFGVVAQAGVFSWFHTSVFSGSTTSLLVVFVFGLVAGFGVYGLKSIGFEYGLHGLNNYLAWVSLFG